MKNIIAILFVFTSLFASSQTQFLGAPNTTIVVKGNMKVDSILYLPKRSKTPTDTGALRYQISDSSLYVWTGSAWRKAKNDGTVTSVGLTMPSAFSVANSPVTSSGTLAVTATGSATEYIRGDGTLGTLPTSGGGGGSGVNYYLNGSVSQGTIGGSTYYEMSKTPVVGTGTNFTASADGLMQQFITDAGDPNRLLIPAGAWNFELYFSASSGGGTPTFYVELLKYNGTTFTSIASSSASPQAISNGTIKTLYFTSLAVSETVLTATDRLAIRVYVNVSGRTITFYTEDANLAEIITTFAGGVVSLNGLTANDQFFATGTSGSDFNISSTSATHTFNLPTASSTVRGALSSANWTTFNNKVNISDTAAMLTNYIRHGGYGLIKTGQALSVDTSAIATRSRVQKGIDSLGLVKQNVLTNPITGTGTTNYVPKWSGTSTQTISQIFDNGTNVGIGTTSPISAAGYTGFTVRNNTNGGIIQNTDGTVDLRMQLNPATTGIIGTFSAHPLQLFGAGAEVARAITGNKLLVNKTSDEGDYKLQVNGGIYGNGNAVFAATGGNVGIGTTTPLVAAGHTVLTVRNATGGIVQVTDGTVDARTLITAADRVNIGTWSTHPVDFVTNGTTKMRLTSAGDVGIGNISPSYKLDITGTLRNTTGAAFATSSGNVLVGKTVDAGVKLDVVGNIANTTGANFATSSGNVGIGMTLPVDKLSVGAITGGAMSITTNEAIGTNASPITMDLNFRGYANIERARIRSIDASNNTNNSHLSFWTSVNVNGLEERMRLTHDNKLGIGTTAPSEALHVTGRIRATTIDSTATGMNMLYADANGVIKKAAVPSGGSGTVTSITAGTGLTGGTITTSGTIAVDTASIATRARVQKGIDSVTTLANTKLSGTGISGYFPKWTGSTTQDTSQLFQLGRNIGIGTASPTFLLHLPDANTTNQAMIAGTVFGSDGNGQTIKPSNSEAMTIYGQNDAGYLHGSVISLVGRWGVNTTSLSDAVFTVNGDVKIVTIDSTATARNMLYQDANGVIKKSAVPSGLSMADDVMTASGSWVATKDAGSGVTINNVAYTTNGTTKMVTIDGNFYIPETSWTDNAWVTISTIPSGFRPSKTINWNSNFIVSGAEYERADNTDFTGAQGIQGQMRIRDDGTVQINATMDVPTIAAGGTDYIIVTFTQSYIIK